MTMRKTPYMRLKYPWTDDVVSPTDVQAMAQDIDQGLVGVATKGADFSKFSSTLVSRSVAQSIPKGTLTTITFDTVTLNNGSDSPQANANWYSASNPTRLTAPVPCIVLASAFGGMDFASALGASGVVQVTVGLNGGATWFQGTKYSPLAAFTGQSYASALTMWKLAAGDYLELRMFWTGTPAGPFNTDSVLDPMLSVMMVALQSVP